MKSTLFLKNQLISVMIVIKFSIRSQISNCSSGIIPNASSRIGTTFISLARFRYFPQTFMLFHFYSFLCVISKSLTEPVLFYLVTINIYAIRTRKMVIHLREFYFYSLRCLHTFAYILLFCIANSFTWIILPGHFYSCQSL